MKKTMFKFFAASLMILGLASFDNLSTWTKTGSNLSKYDMGERVSSNTEGPGVITIKSKGNAVNDFGIMTHHLPAATFQGKRVRISGITKAKDVNAWGGLWLNVNQSASQTIQLENMVISKVSGSSKGYIISQVVMDVPQGSAGISYGAVLKGDGQLFVGRVMFEIVGNEVPLTQ